MKSITEYFWFNTKRQREFINITDKVEDLVSRSGINEGFVLVSAMHITAGVSVRLTVQILDRLESSLC